VVGLSAATIVSVYQPSGQQSTRNLHSERSSSTSSDTSVRRSRRGGVELERLAAKDVVGCRHAQIHLFKFHGNGEALGVPERQDETLPTTKLVLTSRANSRRLQIKVPVAFILGINKAVGAVLPSLVSHALRPLM
jgi:hypothetical protein